MGHHERYLRNLPDLRYQILVISRTVGQPSSRRDMHHSSFKFVPVVMYSILRDVDRDLFSIARHLVSVPYLAKLLHMDNLSLKALKLT